MIKKLAVRGSKAAMVQAWAWKWSNSFWRLSPRLLILVFLGTFLAIRTVMFMIMAGWLDQNVQHKIMVVYAQPEVTFVQLKQGMFSDFFSVIGALIFAERNHAAAVRVFFETDYYVDWRLGPNYWEYYFKPLMVIDPEVKEPPTVHFNRYLARYGVFGSFTPEVVGNNPPHLTFPISHRVPLSQLRRLVHQYIRVQPLVEQHVNDTYNELIGQACMVGLHYRGTDKTEVWPYTTPQYETMRQFVQRALDVHCPNQDRRVYLATDESEIVTYMENAFPGILVYQSSSPRLSRFLGSGGNYATHKSQNFDAHQKGLTAVVDMIILSRARYLVKNRSSLSDASLIYSQTLGDNYTFVLREPDLVFSRGLQ